MVLKLLIFLHFVSSIEPGDLNFTSVLEAVKVGERYNTTWRTTEPELYAEADIEKNPVDRLTTNGIGASYSWAPSNLLPNSKAYYLLLTQRNVAVFSKPFALTGGSASTLSSNSATTSTIFVTVTATSTPTSTKDPPNAARSSPGVGDKAAMGLGITLGVVLLFGVALWVWQKYHKTNRSSAGNGAGGTDVTASHTSRVVVDDQAAQQGGLNNEFGKAELP
ncbi:hypothetical protein EJ08DRAFT_693082 [Tothia fuscella]|uniref:Mid2 domain-containing protein n=1 Tax=Tothia fuscella TaxID=1048955 RepID=A0A9P4P0K4_9PEZI|nr:hypothetical protein EJ08DRAFT_693082 [Tothia fuscella]